MEEWDGGKLLGGEYKADDTPEVVAIPTAHDVDFGIQGGVKVVGAREFHLVQGDCIAGVTAGQGSGDLCAV
jgi:hypothetical protein